MILFMSSKLQAALKGTALTHTNIMHGKKICKSTNNRMLDSKVLGDSLPTQLHRTLFTICSLFQCRTWIFRENQMFFLLDYGLYTSSFLFLHFIHNHSYSYFQLVNTNNAEAYLANQKMLTIANFDKYCQLPKLENIVSCQNWQLLSVANFGKFYGHQSCQMLPVTKIGKCSWLLLCSVTIIL